MSPYPSEFKLMLRCKKKGNVVDGWPISIQKSIFALESPYHEISISWCHTSISLINIMGRCPSSINLLVALNVHPHVMYSYHGSMPIQTAFGIVRCQCTSKFAILLIWLNTHVNSLCCSAGHISIGIQAVTAMGHHPSQFSCLSLRASSHPNSNYGCWVLMAINVKMTEF